MKRMEKVSLKAKKIMDSGDSDPMEKAKIYLEFENLNETIILPSLEINQKSVDELFSMMGKNVLFTNITDMDSAGIIHIYKKRNRVEHCFRTINTMDMAFLIYHRTPQKIRVHIFRFLLAYLFISMIYNEIHKTEESVSLPLTVDTMKDIMVVYNANEKR
jgi:hypothetical protein